jgi:hypothetical protein
MSALDLTELAGRIDRHEETLYELKRQVAATREQTSMLRSSGVVALELERALTSLTTAERQLGRARREAER